MAKDIIPNYCNEDFLEKVRKHNLEVAKTGKGKFHYNAVFIDLNAVKELPTGEKISICCNFNCPGCFKTPEKRYCQTDRLNFDEIKEIMKFAKKHGAKAVVYAGLGEPMLDQDFWKALDFAHEQNLWTIVFTNGTLITKENAKILFKKKTIIIAKLNTFNQEKQDLMVGGIKGAGKKMLEGIKHLLEAGFKAPRLCIDSYISKENSEDLKDVLRFCRKNNIIPYFESFITKGLDENDYKNKILAQNELDNLFLDLQKIDEEEFGVKTELKKGTRVYGQNPCIKYWTMFSVRANGYVALCVSDNEIIGNIRKNPLEKILVANNKKILNRYKYGCNCSITTSQNVEAETIKSLFDKFASARESYEKHMKNTNHINAQKKILTQFYSKFFGKNLDIATGTGIIVRLIAKNTNAKVYGIDFSESMIAKAKEYTKKDKLKITFRIADAEHIPYQDNFFDSITCSYGFGWFQNLDKVIQEIKRILKSGGIILLLEEEFKKGQLPQPVFAKKAVYLKKLASLEKYIPIHQIKEMMKNKNFILLNEVQEKVDENHDTFGLLFRLEK